MKRKWPFCMFLLILVCSNLFLTSCVAPDGTVFHFPLSSDPLSSTDPLISAVASPQPAARGDVNTGCPRVVNAALEQAEPDDSCPPRPILYYAFDENWTIRAIEVDGHAIELDLRGLMLGWSPQGDRFACITLDESTAATDLLLIGTDGTVSTFLASTWHTWIYSVGWQSVWSPDGTRLALLVGDFNDDISVAILDVTSQRIIQRIPLPHSALVDGNFFSGWSPYTLRWSPDGKKVLLAWHETYVVNLASNTIETVVDYPTMAEWLPTSKGIVYFEIFGPMELYQRRVGAQYRSTLVTPETFAQWGIEQPWLFHAPLLKLSPSGRHLVVAGIGDFKSSIIIFEFKGLEGDLQAVPWRSFAFEEAVIGGVEWGPDEQELALLLVEWDDDIDADAQLTLNVLNLDTGDLRNLTSLAEIGAGPPGQVDILAMINVMLWTR